jgi:hypothetical protein
MTSPTNLGLSSSNPSEQTQLEEIKYINWINASFPHFQIQEIGENLTDAITLLEILETIHPAIVDWSKIDRKANNKFKKIQNSNYLISALKDQGIPLVSIAGRDIVDCNQTKIFTVLWFLMREEFVKANGVSTDDAIRDWANQFVWGGDGDGDGEGEGDGEVMADELDFEPLRVLLYFSGDAEIFMNFSDDEGINCPGFPVDFDGLKGGNFRGRGNGGNLGFDAENMDFDAENMDFDAENMDFDAENMDFRRGNCGGKGQILDFGREKGLG